MPIIADVPAMPERRYGRAEANLAPLEAALRDKKPHALEEVRAEEERRR